MRRLMVVFLIVTACSNASAGTSTNETKPPAMTSSSVATGQPWDLSRPFVGFSLSPRSYDESGFDEFFATAPEAGSLVAWVGAWTDLDEGGTLVTGLADEHGYVPVVVTGFPTEDGLRVLPEDGEALVETVAGFVAQNPVPYLGFGVEINAFLWEKAPDDFERYVDLFARVSDAVHEVSPETKVFPGFQLERLRGLKGGLFGDEPTEPEWELLERFPSADAIGFTTYPGLVFTDPGEMPSDYYSEIFERVDQPVVFTEVGWQAGGDLGDWSGTPEKQASFVENQVSEIGQLAEMVIWSFLWDQPRAPRAFITMGLLSSEGEERPAYQTWVSQFGG